MAAPPGSAGMRVGVLVNQRPVGTWDVLPGWKDYELSVGAELLRPGRNFLRLRVAAEGARNMAVAGVWMEP